MIVIDSSKHIRGTSIETKPVFGSGHDGYRFTETDTGNEFRYNQATKQWESITAPLEKRVDSLEEKVGDEGDRLTAPTGLYKKLDDLNAALVKKINKKQDALVITPADRDKYLHVNNKTGELEWKLPSEIYTPGKGILINVKTNTIYVDEKQFTSRDLLDTTVDNIFKHIDVVRDYTVEYLRENDFKELKDALLAEADALLAEAEARQELAEKEKKDIAELDKKITSANVWANPEGEPVADLDTIMINDVIYQLVEVKKFNELSGIVSLLASREGLDLNPYITIDGVDEILDDYYLFTKNQ